MRKKTFLKKASELLNKNPPMSERWFKKLYKPYQDRDDKFNHPFAGKIPDVINKTHRYVIEIDGSIHSLSHIKDNDLVKENLFQNYGYLVIRIEAYNLQSFDNAVQLLKKLRQTITWDTNTEIPIRSPKAAKIIRRKKI